MGEDFLVEDPKSTGNKSQNRQKRLDQILRTTEETRVKRQPTEWKILPTVCPMWG